MESPATPANFKQLINKIRSMGVAVLIVHHANSDNEARGLQSKLDQLAFKFKAYRDIDEDCDLEEGPMWIKYEEQRYEMGKKLREPFQINYSNDDHRWHVTNPARVENAELKLIYEDYRRYGYDRDAICKMLGLQKTALNDRINQA
ncbi:hypothetical protein SDC9_126377 [bioreactor metagenome]|uniref:Uncharacterized protein n=1 Tax=bioreactor metagenome TaxID=1076179 RepID=A0A645CR29_9ZZZZ